MDRQEIAWEEFDSCIFHQWAKDWFLLSAGDFESGNYNMMTVGWGSLGVIWGKPFAMILVRPQRYTAPFLDRYPTFTLSSFPASMRSALDFCGAKSGRDFPDKAKAAGLTATASRKVAAPSYAEADLVLECVKTYVSELKPEEFLPAEKVSELYPQGGLHRVWFGEITAISGTSQYRKGK